MSSAPAKLSKKESDGWTLWEKLATGTAANSAIRPLSTAYRAIVLGIVHGHVEGFRLLRSDDPLQRQRAGTGGLVTFKDSNWLMSIVLPHQPHFLNQPEGVQVFWGYALFPTASAISSPSRWPTATARKSCTNSAAICASIRIVRRPTASLAACPTSPACSCRDRSGSSAAGAQGIEKSGFHQPVRRDSGRCRFHRRIFGARRANGCV